MAATVALGEKVDRHAVVEAAAVAAGAEQEGGVPRRGVLATATVRPPGVAARVAQRESQRVERVAVP